MTTAIPITEEQTQAFREWCRTECEEDEGSAIFSSEFCPLTQDTQEDGERLWQYHDEDGDANGEKGKSHDIHELFESVADEFLIEEDGWDSFIVSAK